METFYALLALCAGNSPITGEFLAQRPVTRSFDVFFDLRLNKRLSKHSWGWWSDTPPRSLWLPVMYLEYASTWRDSGAIVAGAKFCNVMSNNNQFAATWIFYRIWIPNKTRLWNRHRFWSVVNRKVRMSTHIILVWISNHRRSKVHIYVMWNISTVAQLKFANG